MKKLSFITILIFSLYSVYSQSCLPEGIEFTTQSQIDSFKINYPGCSEIEGDVSINGYNITNLFGLAVLTSIGGDLNVGHYYGGNPILTSLSGLEGVTSIGGGLRIFQMDTLSNLTGLNNVVTIAEFLSIYSNDALTNLMGLEGLISIGGFLEIISNSSLTSLIGLDNVDGTIITDLIILENPLLSTCEVKSLCDYLANPIGSIEIHDNAIGCNSTEEVQDSCEAHAGLIDINEDDVSLFPNPASHAVNISIQGFTINEVIVYTFTGQQVFAIRPKSETFDISILQPGMYIVEAMVEGWKLRRKLVVE